MKAYLERINMHPDVSTLLGADLAAKQTTRRKLIENYAKHFVSRGVSPAQLQSVAGSDLDARLLVQDIFFIDRVSYSSDSFSNHLALSELAVIATIDKPIHGEFVSWAGPGAYTLKIKQRLKGSLPFDPIAVMNARSAHGRTFSEGEKTECVFFFSPTLTEYRKAYSETEVLRDIPKQALAEAFSSYCTNEDDIFTVKSYGFGSNSITRKGFCL